MDQVLLSGYFDRIPSHQNGVCEEEEEEEPVAAAAVITAAAPVAVAESSEAEEQAVDAGYYTYLRSQELFFYFRKAATLHCVFLLYRS